MVSIPCRRGRRRRRFTESAAEFQAPLDRDDTAGFDRPEARATDAAMPAQAEATQRFPLGAARAQLHETYIVAETEDGLVIVDQHAAHERLVYERMKEAMAATGVARQLLLIPEVVELEEPRGGAARGPRRRAGGARAGIGSLRHRRGAGARGAGAPRRTRRSGPGARPRRRARGDGRGLLAEGAARGVLRHPRLPRQRARRAGASPSRR